VIARLAYKERKSVQKNNQGRVYMAMGGISVMVKVRRAESADGRCKKSEKGEHGDTGFFNKFLCGLPLPSSNE
jgi:hypothetical protein